MTDTQAASAKSVAPILLDSKEGQALVEESLKDGFSQWPAAKPHARHQLTEDTCGLATSATILQALAAAGQSDAKFDEAQLVPVKGDDSITWKLIQDVGLTFPQVGAMMAAHGALVDIRDADKCSLDEFRSLAAGCLREDGLVSANFSQTSMGACMQLLVADPQ